VGLVCRVVEAHGVATVCVSTGRDLTAQVKPPRGVFVNHPMGNAFGAPGDADTQLGILHAALKLVLTAQQGGVLVDLPHEWPTAFHFSPAASRM
jgi:D-proline reductase (dithiol) PrdB